MGNKAEGRDVFELIHWCHYAIVSLSCSFKTFIRDGGSIHLPKAEPA